MRWGSKRQRAVSAVQFARLSRAERAALRKLAAYDGLSVTDYLCERVGGVLYVENGYSLVFDLTNDRNADADSIAELRANEQTGVSP